MITFFAIFLSLNYLIDNSTYHLISNCIYLIQFFSHILTSFLNPGIPSRKNFLPNYVKENNINLNDENPNLEICRLCNIIIDKNDNVSHCEECDICIIGNIK
jgi:hypothetical protein